MGKQYTYISCLICLFVSLSSFADDGDEKPVTSKAAIGEKRKGVGDETPLDEENRRKRRKVRTVQFDKKMEGDLLQRYLPRLESIQSALAHPETRDGGVQKLLDLYERIMGHPFSQVEDVCDTKLLVFHESLVDFLKGVLYFKVIGLGHHHINAFEYLSAAEDRGCHLALNYLGLIFAQGIGYVRNDKLARWYFKRAMDKGSTDAYLNMGVQHLRGRGIRQNPEKANTYFARAADMGNVTALALQAHMYAYGVGVEEDVRKSNSLREQAQAKGCNWRARNPESFYFYGEK